MTRSDAPSDFKGEIIAALDALKDEFRPGELAYLALTSKPESVIRDHLAYRLHGTLFPGCLVSREYDRVDIAILRGRKPSACLQLKTWSLFTFIDNSAEHFKQVKEDMEKCRNKCPECPAIYSLVIATHIENLVDESFCGAVAYWNGWRRAFSKFTTAKSIESAARRMVNQELRHWRQVHDGRIPGGEAFGTDVSLLYWLCSYPQTQ